MRSRTQSIEIIELEFVKVWDATPLDCVTVKTVIGIFGAALTSSENVFIDTIRMTVRTMVQVLVCMVVKLRSNDTINPSV